MIDEVDTIYKYSLSIISVQMVAMHPKAEILWVAVQRGTPCIWVRTPKDSPVKSENRIIYTIGTGHPMTDKVGKYIGSYTSHGEQLVWHVFEEKR